MEYNIIQIVLSLLTVLGLIIMVGVLAKYFQDKRIKLSQFSNKKLKILEYLVLDNTNKVFLIQYNDQELIITTGSNAHIINSMHEKTTK